MMYFVFFLAALVSISARSADVLDRAPTSARLIPSVSDKFDLQSVSLAQVINLVYQEAFKQAYVVDSAVLSDDRLVSFRFDASKGDMRRFWLDFLDSQGFELQVRNGVDFVGKKKAEEHVEKPGPVMHAYVYRPQYRSVSYVVGLVSPLFNVGGFTVNRIVHAPVFSAARTQMVATGAGSSQTELPSSSPHAALASPTSAAGLIDVESDTLVFYGLADEVEKLKKILPQIDTPTGEVAVKAVVYEVATNKDSGSAFSLALNILGGKLGLSYGNSGALSNAVTFKSGTIDAAISALSSDSRFKTLTSPRLRVRSGSEARLTVGQDVPTLGALQYAQGSSQPVQSIEYRSAGVILAITPKVREAGIDLHVDQQISDFAKTDTGVNGSPTLTKRSFSTDVTLMDGELIVLGGLTQDKTVDAHSGFSFLPKMLHSLSTADGRTEVLLLLQVERVVHN